MPDFSNPTMTTIAKTADELAHAASSTAMKYFRNALEIEVKGDESPVTLADKDIERQARDLLTQRFPDHSILGEEYGAGDLSADDVWIIDPIDGTRSFIGGHPLFGFLLAHMARGNPSLGVISMPALDELYVGRKGEGASLNGKPIQTSGKTKLDDAFLYINEGEKLLEHEPDVLKRLVTAGHTRRYGYDCYPHALLAAGHVDVVVDFDLKPFDYLPLAGVIEAAGGVISDWDGKPLDYNSDGRVISAATPELHRELMNLIGQPERANSVERGSAPIAAKGLLNSKDGLPYEVANLEGEADIFLICEHASNRIPAALGDLGLSEIQQSSHVAWDPGAHELAKKLSSSLDAPLVAARFSRLVYDCNRPPEAASAMPSDTEVCRVPGNASLSELEMNARTNEIYEPFHGAVAGAIASRRQQGKKSVVVSIHSFTPVYNGEQRFVEIGYLHSQNGALAKAMFANSPADQDRDIRLNQPYGPNDGVLHTIEMHTAQGNEPHVMIEVRNDLLSDQKGLQAIHDLIAEALSASLK